MHHANTGGAYFIMENTMPQGFQTFDGSGNLIIDVTTRLTRMIGSFKTTNVNGSFTLTGLTGGESFIYINAHLKQYNDPVTSTGYLFPKITKVGNVVSWEFENEQGTSEREYATVLWGEM